MSKKPKSKRVVKASKSSARAYHQVTAQGGQNNDWVLRALGEDADVKQNIFALRARSRDLFRVNTYCQKYREELWANVFGEHGIMLRSRVKETEDRVVHTPDEKAALEIYERRVNRVREWAATKTGQRIRRMVMTREDDRGQAKVIAGQLDVYANQRIESAWADWKKAQYCDARGRRDYTCLQQLRLLSAARDGDLFVRLVRDRKVNKFGFTLQMLNSEWVDHWLNTELPNGNVIRMGIEYEMHPWGVGKPVAFYFIRRHPRDWEFEGGNMFGFISGLTHDRIDAAEIIHYARFLDIDSTRPAPWSVAVIPKTRQLDAYELAEVIAARVSACKMGWFYSDLIPEGGTMTGTIDPTRMNGRNIAMEPGSYQGLDYGVKVQESNPTHPNGNFDLFRKGMLRSWCAGMPGANYNIIANDAEGVSYSTGRIFSLDDRELWKLLQRFDINTAERPIFENFLEMALITGAIPLPLAKFAKFNQPHFSGRRWVWVDPKADSVANREQLLMGLTSRSRLCDDAGVDFDDVLFELAEEEMLIEELGLNALSLESLAAKGAQPEQSSNSTSGEQSEKPGEDEGGSESVGSPKQGKGNGSKKGVEGKESRTPARNGSRSLLGQS